jgi:hypothetical protein
VLVRIGNWELVIRRRSGEIAEREVPYVRPRESGDPPRVKVIVKRFSDEYLARLEQRRIEEEKASDPLRGIVAPGA